MNRYNDRKDAKHLIQIRLNRIEGQIRGIQGMVERDASCLDILDQIASVRSAIKAAALMLVETHCQECLSESLPDHERLNRILTSVKHLSSNCK